MKYRRQTGGEQRRMRRRGGLAVLPTLFTLGNALCGFASLHYAARLPNAVSGGLVVSTFAISGYLIFAAMIFDALDGRMARLARATSDFGGELDSLADMISFGVAPAFLALRVVSYLLSTDVAYQKLEFLGPYADSALGRLFWFIGAIYVACTALRLARFNIHNRHSEEAHMSFRGLPSPGAAGAVASAVILYETMAPNARHYLPFAVSGHVAEWLQYTFPYAMPVILLVMAGLMVSRFSYAHVTNQYLRGRRSFSYVVRVVVVMLLVILEPQIVATAVIFTYALSAPAVWAYRSLFRPHRPKLIERVEREEAGEDWAKG